MATEGERRTIRGCALMALAVLILAILSLFSFQSIFWAFLGLPIGVAFALLRRIPKRWLFGGLLVVSTALILHFVSFPMYAYSRTPGRVRQYAAEVTYDAAKNAYTFREKATLRWPKKQEELSHEQVVHPRPEGFLLYRVAVVPLPRDGRNNVQGKKGVCDPVLESKGEMKVRAIGLPRGLLHSYFAAEQKPDPIPEGARENFAWAYTKMPDKVGFYVVPAWMGSGPLRTIFSPFFGLQGVQIVPTLLALIVAAILVAVGKKLMERLIERLFPKNKPAE